MGRNVWSLTLQRTSVAIAVLVTSGLQLWVTAARANPTSVSPPPALTAPSLPPLGNADLFLPVPSEKLIHLVIRLGERRVYVYEQGQVIKSYPIAIGQSGWETPTGKFEVIQMLQNPVWEHPLTGELVPPGPANPLGPRWIGFWTDGTNYIGFHGTPNAETVGQAASHGCIRMYDQDVVALFEVVQVGTPVEVLP